MFSANDCSLNKSVFKCRGDGCVSPALSINVTKLVETQWCGEADSARILILLWKELNLYMSAIVVCC